MTVNGKTRDERGRKCSFPFLQSTKRLLLQQAQPSFYIQDFREFLLRCFGRMTISGSGILWIVNCFLASLVRLNSFYVSSRRIDLDRFARDCPSIISQIDSNEYPDDCRTPRFSASSSISQPIDPLQKFLSTLTFAIRLQSVLLFREYCFLEVIFSIDLIV